MTLTFHRDPYTVKMEQQTNYLSRKSRPKHMEPIAQPGSLKWSIERT